VKKILLIGFGNMGKSHFKTIKESELASVYGIIDPSKSISMSENVKIFKSIEQIDFQNLAFDCAIIASSTKSHFKISSKLLDYKIPTLVEKPLTDDINELNNLLRLQKQSNSILRVGFIELYNPTVSFLQNINNNEIVKIEISRLSPPPLRKRGLSDVLYDMTIHDISILAKYFELENSKIKYKKFGKNNGLIDYAEIDFDLNNIEINLTSSTRESKKERTWKLYTANNLHIVDFLNFSAKTVDVSTNKILKNYEFNSETTNLHNQLQDFIDKINKQDLDNKHLKIIKQSHKFIENLYK
jgi:predicted dehydrogenase